MKCPNCNYENEEGASFCNLCYFVFKKEGGQEVPAQSPGNKGQESYKPGLPAESEPSPPIISWRRLFLAIVIIAILVFNLPKIFKKSPREICTNGSYVTINYGAHYINAEMEAEDSPSFLVNNGYFTPSHIAFFFVIPMETAYQLKKQYGDFVHCNSPGAEAGKASLYTIFLVPSDTSVEKKIRGVMKHMMGLPVVMITGHKLNIKEHKMDGRKYFPFDPSGREEFYLTKDIKIMQENYR